MRALHGTDAELLKEDLGAVREKRLKAAERDLMRCKPWLISSRFNRGEIPYIKSERTLRIPLT